MTTTIELPADSAGALSVKTREPQPSRRGFLAQAAAVAAGGAAIGAALPMPVSAGESGRLPDPILAVIEAHKAVSNALNIAVSVHSQLEQLLPGSKRQSSISIWEEKIVETDDPQWIESERELLALYDAETDAAIDLVSIQPTTGAGLLALLNYSISADVDGESWPDDLQSDDGKRIRPWHYFLIESIAEALPELLGVA